MINRRVYLRFPRPNEQEHWAIAAEHFVDDDYGRWFKAGPGWEMWRPGKTAVVDPPSVWLLPSRGN